MRVLYHVVERAVAIDIDRFRFKDELLQIDNTGDLYGVVLLDMAPHAEQLPFRNAVIGIGFDEEKQFLNQYQRHTGDRNYWIVPAKELNERVLSISVAFFGLARHPNGPTTFENQSVALDQLKKMFLEHLHDELLTGVNLKERELSRMASLPELFASIDQMDLPGLFRAFEQIAYVEVRKAELLAFGAEPKMVNQQIGILSDRLVQNVSNARTATKKIAPRKASEAAASGSRKARAWVTAKWSKEKAAYDGKKEGFARHCAAILLTERFRLVEGYNYNVNWRTIRDRWLNGL